MEWYRFTAHFTEKTAIDDFINSVHSMYADLNEHQLTYSVYQKSIGNKLLVLLNTNDLEIARLFIDHFVDYEHFLEEPIDL